MTTDPPNPKPKSRGWRRCRIGFRCLRILSLILVLVLAGFLLLLNFYGLPGFIKNRLIAELQARGLDLSFSRLRLDGFRKIVVENLNLGHVTNTNAPQVYIDEAELIFNGEALRRFQAQVDGLRVRSGRLVWHLVHSNEPPRELTVDDISSEVLFRSNDRWELANFQARTFGASLRLSATLTNLALLQKKPAPSTTSARPKRVAKSWQQQLYRFAELMSRFEYAQPPDLKFTVQGDLADPSSFQARLVMLAAHTKTPWGALQGLDFGAYLVPSKNNPDALDANLTIKLDNADTPWGQLERALLEGKASYQTNVPSAFFTDWEFSSEALAVHGWSASKAKASLRTVRDIERPEWLISELKLTTGQVRSNAFLFSNLTFDALLTHEAPVLTRAPKIWSKNPHLDGKWKLSLGQAQTQWGQAGLVNLSGQVKSRTDRSSIFNLQSSNPEWGFWNWLTPYELAFSLDARAIQAPKLQVEQTSLAAAWRPPVLELQKLDAKLYGGELHASGRLPVDSRLATASGAFNFNAHGISNLLTPASQKWLRQFSWTTPPDVHAHLSATLPVWTNPSPNWRREVMPTIKIDGAFTASAGAFRRVPVDGATGHFYLTNLIWNIPDLQIRRPEGLSDVLYIGSMDNQDYYWKIRATFDPKALRPLFDQKQQRGLDYFQFPAAPRLEGEIWGRWGAPELTGFKAAAAVTNFVFRGEKADWLRANVQYTNRVLQFADVTLFRGRERIYAPAGAFHIAEDAVFLTNAIAEIDPHVVAKVIGPKTLEAVRPYKFLAPPTVRVNGRIPTRDERTADAFFEVAGGPFSYWKFNVPDISGDIRWRGDDLSLSNVVARFYNGRLDWAGHFDFRKQKSSDFNFHARVHNTDLRLLMRDLVSSSNQMEGFLNAELVITSANSADWKSWNGHGWADLKDGFLWNVPIFGIFAPILNSLSPGLGHNRASDGKGAFQIRESVIHTKDMEVRSPALRLKYEGTVDFDGNLNASMEAQLLRDVWLVGRVFSLAFWPVTKLLEYKIAGTLGHPIIEPQHVPKILLFPLRPIDTIKEILPKDKEKEKDKPKDNPPAQPPRQ